MCAIVQKRVARNSCTKWPMQCMLCRDTVCLYAIFWLHLLVYYAREYYFWNRKPLADRLTLAAAGAGHALALWRGCIPFDTQWYCDLAEELSGVFWDVQQD